MSKRRLLDLCCGAGGASMGYALADFEIVGVDLLPQPHYPFEFHQADALTLPLECLRDFTLIHASPPCQGYSWTSHIYHCQQRPYPKLIEAMRGRLQEAGVPYVMENVVGAPLLSPLTLCGTTFGLLLRRHRLFEASFPLHTAGPCQHGKDFGVYAGKVTRIGTRGTAYRAGSGRTHYRPKTASVAHGRHAMGIDWMDIKELSQAIPPAYTRYVGTLAQAYLVERGLDTPPRPLAHSKST